MGGIAMDNLKVYVKMKTDFDREENMRPLSLTWEDDHVYEIDRVLHIDHRPALKAGGSGLRYTVRNDGHESLCFMNRIVLLVVLSTVVGSLREKRISDWKVFFQKKLPHLHELYCKCG